MAQEALHLFIRVVFVSLDKSGFAKLHNPGLRSLFYGQYKKVLVPFSPILVCRICFNILMTMNQQN